MPHIPPSRSDSRIELRTKRSPHMIYAAPSANTKQQNARAQRPALSSKRSTVLSSFSRLILLCHNFLLACTGFVTLCGLRTSSVRMFNWCLWLLSLTLSIISWVTGSHYGAVASTLSLENVAAGCRLENGAATKTNSIYKLNSRDSRCFSESGPYSTLPKLKR